MFFQNCFASVFLENAIYGFPNVSEPDYTLSNGSQCLGLVTGRWKDLSRDAQRGLRLEGTRRPGSCRGTRRPYRYQVLYNVMYQAQ